MAYRAFIIGINTHGLQYCKNDAVTIVGCLKSYGYEIVEINSDSTRGIIIDKFSEFIDGCNKTDTVIVYFSGHGNIQRGELELLINNATHKNFIKSSDVNGRVNKL